MAIREITTGIYEVGVNHSDLKFFDRLMPTTKGTTYNSYYLDGGTARLLIDPVEELFAQEQLANLAELGVDRLDFLFCLHTEQDHAGGTEALLARYPEARLCATSKVVQLMTTHLHLPAERFLVLEDGESLDLGSFRLTVKSVPFAHWPDNTMLLLEEPRYVFSSDLFGSHYALADEEDLDPREQLLQAKTYYAEIMMPFRSQVKKYEAFVRELAPEKILSAHGPVWHEPTEILDAYRLWASDQVSDRVVIFSCSMHESTRKMTERLAQRLLDQGLRVSIHDLGDEDRDLRVTAGEGLQQAVNAAAVVFATPTVLGGPHPNTAFAALLLNALRPKTRILGLLGSYGWGTQVEKTMKSLLSGIKAAWLPAVLEKGLPDRQGLERIDQLASQLGDAVREAVERA